MFSIFVYNVNWYINVYNINAIHKISVKSSNLSIIVFVGYCSILSLLSFLLIISLTLTSFSSHLCIFFSFSLLFFQSSQCTFFFLLNSISPYPIVCCLSFYFKSISFSIFCHSFFIFHFLSIFFRFSFFFNFLSIFFSFYVFIFILFFAFYFTLSSSLLLLWISSDSHGCVYSWYFSLFSN